MKKKHDSEAFRTGLQPLVTLAPVLKALEDGHEDPRALFQDWLDDNADILASAGYPLTEKEGK